MEIVVDTLSEPMAYIILIIALVNQSYGYWAGYSSGKRDTLKRFDK